jgi:hypothetical protein
MRKYKKIILWGLIAIVAVIFWEKAGIISSNKNYFSSFSITPSKEEIIVQTRSLSEVMVVSAYDEILVDTVTFKLLSTFDGDNKPLQRQNFIKIKGTSKASVPIKNTTAFQIVSNEDSLGIHLQQPEMVSVTIDSILNLTSSIVSKNAIALSRNTVGEIKELLKKRAEEHQIYSIATWQSINILGNYYKFLGFRKVYFY